MLKLNSDLDRDIHPNAVLSKIYFENIFCLNSNSGFSDRSEIGVKVALGDGTLLS